MGHYNSSSMKSRLKLSGIGSLIVLSVALASGCSQPPAAPAKTSAAITPAAATAVLPPVEPGMPASDLPKPDVNGTRVMQYVKEVVAFGPRPVGSAAHTKLEQYILSKLKGVDVEQDKFTAQTPVGKMPINNIVAKFPGKKDGIIVVAGHYDTLYNRPDFVGANDAGSSTALLLELADQLRGKQLDGYSIWLLWTDGEEAFVNWFANNDNDYGSRQLAHKWQQDGTAKKIRAFILVDMIGDADLDILKDTNSTPWLSELVYKAASNLGYQSHFYQGTAAMDDDHLPFAKVGIPVVDLIDFTYGYNNVFWHTPQDTVDKLSPQSLAITTDVVLETMRLVDQR
jgi:glutaminyl-peptide cyclotransferase